jgi:Mg2+ and Co2+ transporter CorA
MEYWINNKMKAYIYAIGLISMIFLPLIVIADCFFPLLGKSPSAAA